MKTPVIYILLLVSFFSSVAQTDTSKTPDTSKKISFEIGTNVYSIDLNNRYQSRYFQFYQGNLLQHSFINGIYFKWFKNVNGFRAAINYYEHHVEWNYNHYVRLSSFYYYDYPSPVTALAKSGEWKLGYQKMIRTKLLSPYFFSDLRYAYSKQKGSYSIPNFTQVGSKQFLIEQHTMGISYGLGLRLTLARKFTFNAETSLEYYFVKGKNLKRKEEYWKDVAVTICPLLVSIGAIFN